MDNERFDRNYDIISKVEIFKSIGFWIGFITTIISLILVMTNYDTSKHLADIILLYLGLIVSIVAITTQQDIYKFRYLLNERCLKDCIKIKVFNNFAEEFHYLAKRISEAKESVDDITFGEPNNLSNHDQYKAFLEAKRNYQNSIKALLRKDTLEYRELLNVKGDPGCIVRQEDIFNSSDAILFNYSLGVYRDKNLNTPLVSFVIIDKKEVIFGYHYTLKDDPRNDRYFSTNHHAIVQYFINYYDELWYRSEIISKIGPKNPDQILSKLRSMVLENTN